MVYRDVPDPLGYLDNLKECMQNLRPLQPRPTQQTNRIAKSLVTSTNVFVQTHAPRKPLQPPDIGPYDIVKRTVKDDTISSLHHSPLVFTTGWREILREVKTRLQEQVVVPSGGAGEGSGEEKCSTLVSLCAGLRRSTETVSLQSWISTCCSCVRMVRAWC